ncbi:MAG: hypothetical protein NC311_03635 [Muribaculaceae bacterium]|nr:hypothetical protein [Muribaculaceae bacterium]
MNVHKNYAKISLKERKKKMKKLIQKISFASLMLMATATSSFAANAGDAFSGNMENSICTLITEMGGLFRTLRTLAFIGAAFIIAGWAWGYISAGKGVDIKDVKDKGIGMLVGFMLLFGVGIILSVFMADNGPCKDAILSFGKGI